MLIAKPLKNKDFNMKQRNTTPVFGNVVWPMLRSGESLEIRDMNDEKNKLSFVLSRDYFGREDTDASKRIYYWFMRAADGRIIGAFMQAVTDHFRKCDAEQLLACVPREGHEDYYLAKGRRFFKVDLPPIGNTEDEADS